jgi:hypothetical protein
MKGDVYQRLRGGAGTVIKMISGSFFAAKARTVIIRGSDG